MAILSTNTPESIGDTTVGGASEESETVERQNSPPVEQDKPPDGGYGWVCVAMVFLINMHVWGTSATYGIFLDHYLTSSLFPSATRLEFAIIGGFTVSMAFIVSPVATITTRYFGTRWTLLLGAFLETGALVAASFASQIWHLFLSQGICFGFGCGFLFVGSVGILPQWFSARRSLANGIASAGAGLGGLVYCLATEAMIRNISLPWALRILGIVAGTVNTVASLVVKDRNKAVGAIQSPFDLKLLRYTPFLLLLGWGFLSMLGYIILAFSLPNFATSVGMSPEQGSLIVSLFSLGQMMGRPFIGYFSDTTGRINMAAIMTFLAGFFALVIWIFAKTFGVLVFYALIGGPMAGTFFAVVAGVTPEVVGLQRLPVALSMTWLILVLPTTFAEPIALEIAGHNSEYLGAQLFAGFAYIGAAICLVFLRAWKIGELEELKYHTTGLVTEKHAGKEGKPSGSASKRGMIFVRRMFKIQKV